jgi:hypothetical protein
VQPIVCECEANTVAKLWMQVTRGQKTHTLSLKETLKIKATRLHRNMRFNKDTKL